MGVGRAGIRRRHRHVFRPRHAKPHQPTGNGPARARRQADRAGPRRLLAQRQRRHHGPGLRRQTGANPARTDRRRPRRPERRRRQGPFRPLTRKRPRPPLGKRGLIVVAFLGTRGLVGAAGREARGVVVVVATAAAAVPAAIAAALAVVTTAQHGQLAVEALQHDLGRVFLDALGVGVFAGLQRALDVNGRALLQVVLGHLDDVLVENDDRVPLGLFLALAGGLVAPLLRRGDAQVGDAVAAVQRADFRVLAQVADEDDLVDAAGHDRCPFIFVHTRAGGNLVRGDGDGATVDLALDGARNGQTTVPGACQGEEALPRQGLAELDAAPVDKDELPLIGADHVAVVAAHAEEAQAHLLKPRGAEFDLLLVAGDDVDLRRGLAVLGQDHVIADAGLGRSVNALLGAGGDGQAQKTQGRGVAVLLGQGAEAAVVVRLLDATRHQTQGGVAPAAILGLARTDAGAGVEGLNTGAQAHAVGNGAPFRAGVAQTGGGRRRGGRRTGGLGRRRALIHRGDLDGRLGRQFRRRGEGGGRRGGQGAGGVQTHVQGAGGHAVALGAVGQGGLTDKLSVDEAAQFARRLQRRGLGQIDRQPALRRRRGFGRAVASAAEHQGGRYGRDDGQAAPDDQDCAIVFRKGHAELDANDGPNNPGGAAPVNIKRGSPPLEADRLGRNHGTALNGDQPIRRRLAGDLGLAAVGVQRLVGVAQGLDRQLDGAGRRLGRLGVLQAQGLGQVQTKGLQVALARTDIAGRQAQTGQGVAPRLARPQHRALAPVGKGDLQALHAARRDLGVAVQAGDKVLVGLDRDLERATGRGLDLARQGLQRLLGVDGDGDRTARRARGDIEAVARAQRGGVHQVLGIGLRDLALGQAQLVQNAGPARGHGDGHGCGLTIGPGPGLAPLDRPGLRVQPRQIARGGVFGLGPDRAVGNPGQPDLAVDDLHISGGIVARPAVIGQPVVGRGAEVAVDHGDKGVRAAGMGRVDLADVQGAVAGRACEDHLAIDDRNARDLAAGVAQVAAGQQSRRSGGVDLELAHHHAAVLDPGGIELVAVRGHGLDIVVPGRTELVDARSRRRDRRQAVNLAFAESLDVAVPATRGERARHGGLRASGDIDPSVGAEGHRRRLVRRLRAATLGPLLHALGVEDGDETVGDIGVSARCAGDQSPHDRPSHGHAPVGVHGDGVAAGRRSRAQRPAGDNLAGGIQLHQDDVALPLDRLGRGSGADVSDDPHRAVRAGGAGAHGLDALGQARLADLTVDPEGVPGGIGRTLLEF
uniref:PE-PGRS family protein n=1 Tax=Parastrongyloides trichosuri TaxID=131310 RepID=A0A0N5A028_PARTI